jgi:hypothetical protein
MRDVPAGVGLALSPDGATLAVVARNGIRNGNNPQRSVETLFFTVGVDGRNYQLLHGPFTNDTLAKVAWSRDGRTIHFVQSPFDQKVGNLGWQLWSLPVNGGKPHFAGLSLEKLRPDWITTGAATDPRFARLNVVLNSIDIRPNGSLLFSAGVNPKYETWSLDGVLPTQPPAEQVR